MEAVNRRRDETGPGKQSSDRKLLTPSERFKRHAEKIAQSAKSKGCHRAKPGGSQVVKPMGAEAYDSVPFGLRRRIPARFAVPEAALSRREDPATTDEAAREQREIERIRQTCLQAAEDLQLEIQAIDAELARASSGAEQDRVHSEPVTVPCGKVMSAGSEGSLSRRRE